MLRIFLEKHRAALFFVSLCSALISFGFTAGLAFEKYQEWRRAPGFRFLPEKIENEIPLVIFEKIENGVLYGRNEGKEMRFVVGADKEIFPEQNGEFSFPVVSILPNLRRIPAPSGMLFAASKNGTKFWPLDAPEAALLAPKNRIFFRSAAEAAAQGFSKGGS